MLTIALVDDQQPTREGLRTVIAREQCGWDVVWEASTGLEAQVLLQQKPVDLLITDIRMPDMDGVALMQWLQAQGMDTLMVVLTAYSEFSYAKAALQCGAVGYLLKPIDPEGLFESIRQAEDLQAQRQQRLMEQQRIREDQELLRSLVLARLCNGGYTAERQAQEDLLRADCTVAEYTLMAWCRRVHPPVAQRLLKEGESAGFFYHPLVDEQKMSLYFVWRDSPCVSGWEEWRSAWREATPKGGWGLSDPRALLMDAPLAISEAFDRCAQEEGVKDGWPEAGEVSYPYELEHRFIFAIKSGDGQTAEAMARELALRLFSSRKSTLYDLSLMARRSIWALKRIQSNAPENRLAPEPGFASMLTREELREWFFRQLSEIRDQELSLRTRKGNRIVEKVQQIVKLRYPENLTVRDIAQELFINPSYLSELFKQHAGCTFTDYLTNYRINQAQALLCDGNRYVYEVADAVGYRNYRHFNQVFKRIVGVLPNDYRKHAE